MNQEIKVFSGNSNKPLAEEICSNLNIPLGDAFVGRFSDGEIHVQINENVRGKDVFLIQSGSAPVNRNLMELLIMIDALKRASAGRITAVIPYFCYARQDRKVQPRVPITSKLVADLITAAGANRLLTMDLHAGQIQGFFNIPVDHLFAEPVLIDYLQKKNFSSLVVISPDAGGVERARAIAKKLKLSLAIIDKRRDAPNVAKVMNIIGDVKDKDVIIIDDIIDTAGTLIQAVDALTKNGAVRVFASCTHPVLSGPAIERISNSEALEEVIVTNTIALNENKKIPKIKVLSVASLLAKAINNIHTGQSVSSLFV
ncbi:MAG: ribose-phosphate pyrophosphokinase [Candidatus Schekmanbacteria bacterium]|nr:MAG: ribose-phosphate pyrophosphokinase [Candidatus Schekmanbacteria bacterium]